MKRFLIIKTIFSISLIIFFLSDCNKSNNTGYTAPPANNNSTGTSPNTVVINGMSYSPATVTVAKGTSVKWINKDANTHTVTSNDGTRFDSGNIPGNGGVYTYLANTAGTFEYHCTIHGIRMAGTLIVNP